MHVCMYVGMYLYASVCVCARMYEFTSERMYVVVQECISVSVSLYVCTYGFK